MMTKSNLPAISEEQLSLLMDGEWDQLNSSQCVAGICNDEHLRNKWSRYHLIRDCMRSRPFQINTQLHASISAAIAEEPTYSNITPLSTSTNDMEGFGSDDLPQIADHYDAINQTGDYADAFEPGSSKLVNSAESDAGPLTASATAGKTPSAVLAADRTFWGTGLKGFAVAASVAAFTVFGISQWQGQQAVPVNSADATIAHNTTVPATGADAFSHQINGVQLPQVEFVANTGGYWISPHTAKRVSGEKRLNMFLSQHLENSPTASRQGILSYSRLVGYDEQAAQ